MKPMLNEYYTEREWDPATGIPKAEKLRRTGLSHIIEDLRRNGIEIK